MSRNMKMAIRGSCAKTCTFPRTITEAQSRAFYWNKTLQSVRPNEGLETLRPYAFAHSGLRSFTAPASLKRIEDGTFKDCENLRHADFSASTLRSEDGCNYFSQHVFEKSGLESIVLPSTLRVIKEKLFYGLESLKSVEFRGDSQLEEIRARVFDMCGLESFTAPASLRKVGEEAFACCYTLKHMDLSACTLQSGDGNDFFFEGVFQDSGLESIVLPSTFRTIKERLFANLRSLKSVELGEDSRLEEIRAYAFYKCGLESFIAPPSLHKLGENAFAYCRALKHVDLSSCTFRSGGNEDLLPARVFFYSALESIQLPRTLRAVGKCALAGCEYLKSVSFGDDSMLEEIQSEAFKDSGLESFVAPPLLKKIGDFAFRDCKMLRHVDLSSCVLISDSDFLSNDVFAGNGLESIILPQTLKTIGEGKFAGCKSLKSVSFGTNSVLEEIGSRAFYGCGLESFTAPPSLKKIGDLAFGHCLALKDFRLNEGIQELGFLCFWATEIEDLKIPARVRRTPEKLGLDQKDPEVLCLPNGFKTVGNVWFRNSNVEKVIIPSSVKKLGEYAFYYCQQLREVNFEPGSCLERIEGSCFRWCGLTRIVIPGSVQYIGKETFGECKQLCEVVFEPDSHLESIDSECFCLCGLVEIVIPRSVRSIGDHAFNFCKNLSSFRFEEGSQISSIGTGAFRATQLSSENVKYPNTLITDGREWDVELDVSDLF